MTKLLKKLMVYLAALCMVISAAGCSGRQTAKVENGEALYTIGVAVYDPDNTEMEMFLNYYRDYIAEGFPVEFYCSDAISSVDDEEAFIHEMKKVGAKGIISFYGTDIQRIIKVCEAEEIYYIYGSGTISDEDFEAVKDNPWFLGTVGPEATDEYQAGYDMASWFWEQGARAFIILSGGAAENNFMHYSRVLGMLTAISEKSGLSFGDLEVLAKTEKNIQVATGSDEVSIDISAGYLSGEENLKNFETTLSETEPDALMSAFYVSDVFEQIDAKERQSGKDIKVGTVDCFSEDNFNAVKAKDSFGSPKIDYIQGKYASMAGPAFAVLFNAMDGNLDVVRPDGGAVRLYQGFWTAAGRETYTELYGYTTGIYENAYSCADLMKTIKSYHPEATFEDLKTLTESYDIDSVKARILEN